MLAYLCVARTCIYSDIIFTLIISDSFFIQCLHRSRDLTTGLALWPGASLEVHALLSEAPAPGEFGRPKRELFHRCPGCVALLRDVGIESFADYLKFATSTVIPTYYYVFIIYRIL